MENANAPNAGPRRKTSSRRRQHSTAVGSAAPTAVETGLIIESPAEPAATKTPQQPKPKKAKREETSADAADATDASKAKLAVCRDFVTKGACRFGDKCRFSHEASTLAAPAAPIAATVSAAVSAPPAPAVVQKGVCNAFLKGNCHRGEKCRFAHVTDNLAPEVAPAHVHTHAVAPMEVEEKAVAADSEPSSLLHMSTKEFASLPICASTRKAIAEVLKYKFLTHVQEASLPVILQGKDCLAKAKTGTGKTLGFLIPSIELMIRNAALIDAHHIPTLVISPNRELAGQIAEEAKALLTFNNVRKTVVCLYGGVKITKDATQLRQKDIAVLVVTPGRFIDHLQNTPGFVERLQSLRMVVLDEADQLLDMGFKPAIDRIFQVLPPAASRQTLFFSATVPPAVQEIAKSKLKRGYEYVDTVGEVTAEQTHEHVAQELVVVPDMRDLIATVYAVLQEQIALSPQSYKMIVFFPTARAAGFMAEIFSHSRGLGLQVLEIHSRMSQSARQKTSDVFRTGKRVILFSSDVSARGMDYPDVSFVLQVGSTEKSQYIHRLGRTARAGKEGSGMLVLNGFEEQSMLKELKGLPLAPRALSTLNIAAHDARVGAALRFLLTDTELKKSAEQAYQAWLGYYNGKLRALGWSKEMLVEKANEFSRSCGLTQVPALEAKTVGKMGLRGTAGLRIAGR